MADGDLGVKVADNVKMDELFGQMGRKMAGIGGTLHITDEASINSVPKIAWDLSKASKKPVVIVVNAPQ